MNKFLAGGMAAILMIAAGLFWWQGRASRETTVTPRPEMVAAADLEPPVGDDNAFGAPPPMPPSATPQSREQRRFDRYDRNRDGIISRAEMLASRTKAFKALDKDGNNLLSFEEWAVATSDRFAKADGDSDGKLSRAEFATTAPKPKVKQRCGC